MPTPCIILVWSRVHSNLIAWRGYSHVITFWQRHTVASIIWEGLLDFSVLSKCGGPLGALSIPWKAFLLCMQRIKWFWSFWFWRLWKRLVNYKSISATKCYTYSCVFTHFTDVYLHTITLISSSLCVFKGEGSFVRSGTGIISVLKKQEASDLIIEVKNNICLFFPPLPFTWKWIFA